MVCEAFCATTVEKFLSAVVLLKAQCHHSLKERLGNWASDIVEMIPKQNTVCTIWCPSIASVTGPFVACVYVCPILDTIGLLFFLLCWGLNSVSPSRISLFLGTHCIHCTIKLYLGQTRMIHCLRETCVLPYSGILVCAFYLWIKASLDLSLFSCLLCYLISFFKILFRHILYLTQATLKHTL